MAVPEVLIRLRRAPIALIALFAFSPLLSAAPQRLFLSSGGPGTIESSYTGMTDITIEPPFEGARLTVSIDGQVVSRGLNAPYKIEVDFGPAAVEHQISIKAVSVDGSRQAGFNRVVNRGFHPLSVELQEIDPANHIYEAKTTAPPNDPVVKVEFFDQDGPIGSVSQPPYRIRVPEKSLQGVLRATATAQSGAEAADYVAGGEQIHVEAYDVRTVKLFVSVTDRKGVSRIDLTPDKFHVFDNGVKAKILDIGRAETEPIAVALVVDTSASMSPWIDTVSEAASSFLKSVLRTEDSCAVLSVQSVPRRVLPLTTDIASAAGTLKHLQADGETALYDGLESAVRELRGSHDRRAIVVLTDGDDTSSIASYDDALQAVNNAGIPVFVIAFADQTQPITQLDQLGYLAAQTGGFLAQADPHTLAEKYRLIEKDLREQYAIRYQISDVSRPKEWRRVKVVVDSPTMTARTISGYFTP